MIGGFLAAVWTDLFQSVLMWIGVMALLGLTLWKIGGIEIATQGAVAKTGISYAFGPGYSPDGRQFLPRLPFRSFSLGLQRHRLAGRRVGKRLMARKDTKPFAVLVFALAVYIT